MNTRMEYLYRDRGNYKKHNVVIIAGEITSEQIDIIMSCLDMGELFIPEQVGLPAERLEEYEFQLDDDTPFLELHRTDFSLTREPQTCDMTAEKLVSKFQAAKGKWYLDDFGW